MYKLKTQVLKLQKLGVVEYQRKNTAKGWNILIKLQVLHKDNTKKQIYIIKSQPYIVDLTKLKQVTMQEKAFRSKTIIRKNLILLIALYGSSINDCGNDQFEKEQFTG